MFYSKFKLNPENICKLFFFETELFFIELIFVIMLLKGFDGFLA